MDAACRQADGFDDIRGALDQGGAIPNQLVASLGPRVER
jgi:hypothetical protein